MIEKVYKIENPSEEFIRVKHRGRIYTPDYLVSDILNQGHYIIGNINKKNVIDIKSTSLIQSHYRHNCKNVA